ncbi:unnamed protein product, partial [Polarella glacialis]
MGVPASDAAQTESPSGRPVPSPLSSVDIGLEDDERLRAIVGEPPTVRAAAGPVRQELPARTPLASASGDVMRRSDDSALVTLLSAEAAAARSDDAKFMKFTRIAADDTRGPKLTRVVSDDLRLSKLIGPSQAERDDELLAAEIGRPPDKASEVLGKIASLRADRERRKQDSRVLESMLGPSAAATPSGDAVVQPPVSSLLLRVRRVRVIQVRFDDLPGGSLCYFAAIGDALSVKYLCEQAKRCDDRYFVSSPDCRGRTALHHAAYEGNAEVADLLLQAGADVLQRDYEDRSALHVAASRGQVEMARLMIGTC